MKKQVIFSLVFRNLKIVHTVGRHELFEFLNYLLKYVSKDIFPFNLDILVLWNEPVFILTSENVHFFDVIRAMSRICDVE